MRKRWFAISGLLASGAAIALAIATWQALPPLPNALPPASDGQIFTARDGTPLNVNVGERFNRAWTLPLWQIPRLTRIAFITAEDRRYRDHGGADWLARFAALWENIKAGHVVRGASTIGEQASRILHPRPSTYWSHWLAGFDASRLLRRFGHDGVLQFYLNQVPYGGQRRGVAAAARYYFGRAIGALNPAEQTALAILVRAPAAYDPFRHPKTLRHAIDRLARRMHADGMIDGAEWNAIRRATLHPRHARLKLDAGPFVVHAQRRAAALGLTGPRVRTTLDANLEAFVQQTLRTRLALLADRGASNGAALVVDNRSGAILAWAVAPAGSPYDLDPVILARQPGSTLKPFVYALAMKQLGWQADTTILDAPFAEYVNQGVHDYHNYSSKHYGKVSLRYALANSLNVPAVKTAQATGATNLLELLRNAGFTTLVHNAAYYGPALAIGDGPVRLHDLVQAYSMLARHGKFLPLHALAKAPIPAARPVLPGTITSLLANILSDPNARTAEFGSNSVLDLPYPTAVKTGTSSDYRDSWTVGFDNRYTVGVWMGRLQGGSMHGITGSMGPAPVLRAIFAHLRRHGNYAGLWRSPKLVPVTRCEWLGQPACIRRNDWQIPGTGPVRSAQSRITIARPVAGETLAIDPRIPRSAQRYHFRLNASGASIQSVIWNVDGKPLPNGSAGWQIAPGKHMASATVWLPGIDTPVQVAPVRFRVLPAIPLATGATRVMKSR